MRFLAAALVLPLLAACTPDAPVAVAAPAAPAVPVPAGCTVDPATRAAIGAMSLDEASAAASELGLTAGDVLRLWGVRDGTASPADVAYAVGCLGASIPA